MVAQFSVDASLTIIATFPVWDCGVLEPVDMPLPPPPPHADKSTAVTLKDNKPDFWGHMMFVSSSRYR
jgi:hypothetical protein